MSVCAMQQKLNFRYNSKIYTCLNVSTVVSIVCTFSVVCFNLIVFRFDGITVSNFYKWWNLQDKNPFK